jgi:flagellar basal-body rod protein FlgG
MPTVSLNVLLHVSRTGLQAQQTKMNTLAHNISNINTAGYKHVRAEFQELLDSQIDGELTDGSNRLSGQASGTRLSATQRLFEQGELEQSQYPWDLAIEGDGFFQVRLPDGSVAYTRDGTFRLDGEGRLTTADGYLLIPPFALPPDSEDVMVNPDGVVMVRRRGEVDPVPLATITLARFVNPEGLDDVGDNLLRETAAAGSPIVAQPGAFGMGNLVGHALEKSNVDLAQEMVDLISTQRAYTLIVHVLQASDEMLGMANQMRSA